MPHSHHSHLCTPASAHGIGRDSILHLHAMNRSINFSDQNKLRWRPMLRVIQPNRLDPTRQPNHTFLLICLTKLLLVFYVIKSRWRATLILRLSPYSILITVRPSLSLATLTLLKHDSADGDDDLLPFILSFGGTCGDDTGRRTNWHISSSCVVRNASSLSNSFSFISPSAAMIACLSKSFR